MRVKCLHGYFIFEETALGQVSDFISYSGLPIEPKDNYYTFQKLLNFPQYSIKGKDLLGFTALKTFEGKPWEILEANELVYDFTLDQIRLISSVTQNVLIRKSGNRFVSNGLILPGSLTAEGERVRDYAAWFSRDRLSFLYSEVGYV